MFLGLRKILNPQLKFKVYSTWAGKKKGSGKKKGAHFFLRMGPGTSLLDKLYLMRHVLLMSELEISIRELHARTGHYIRKAAAEGRILVTHRGRPMAELRPLSEDAGATEGTTWKDREILPAFAKVMDEPVGGTDSSLAVAEDRERN